MDVIDGLGRAQPTNHVNESGLYALIFGSREEEAKRFKRWVTQEVLPTIRRNGNYRAGPSVAQYLAAQSLRLRLLDRLEFTRQLEMRQTIHDQLRLLSDLMGLPTPPLESVRPAGSPDSASVSQLWVVLNMLREKGVPYNHAHDPRLLAISSPHIEKLCAEHRLMTPSLRQMRRALAAAPRFIDYRTVKSTLTGRSTKCWVFQADGLPPAA